MLQQINNVTSPGRNFQTSCREVGLPSSSRTRIFFEGLVNNLIWFVPDTLGLPQLAAKLFSNLSNSDMSRMPHVIFEEPMIAI